MNEQAKMMNQQQQQHLMNLTQNMTNMNQMNPQSQPQQMPPMNRGYGMWPQPPLFQKPNLNPGAMKPPSASFKKPLGPRSSWKGNKVNRPNEKRRNEQQKPLMAGGGSSAGFGISGAPQDFNNYQPPTLNELQHQNRMKTRKFFPKKKFNNKKFNNCGFAYTCSTKFDISPKYKYVYNLRGICRPASGCHASNFIVKSCHVSFFTGKYTP